MTRTDLRVNGVYTSLRVKPGVRTWLAAATLQPHDITLDQTEGLFLGQLAV